MAKKPKKKAKNLWLARDNLSKYCQRPIYTLYTEEPFFEIFDSGKLSPYYSGIVLIHADQYRFAREIGIKLKLGQKTQIIIERKKIK